MKRLAARLNLIVDADEEAEARAIGDSLIARTELETVYLGCAPYPKLGPHSRLSFALFLPAGVEGQAVIDSMEAVAAQAVAPKALMDGYLNSFLQDDGSLVYNRIFDARNDTFLVAGVLWMDLEIESHPEAQASFQSVLKRED
jgi:hypothetical protein